MRDPAEGPLGLPPWNEDSTVNKIITYKIDNLSRIRKKITYLGLEKR